MSIKAKDENGKNTSDAVDFKLYSLSKFVRLALDNNPNILELLFVNDENIMFINDIGKNLLDLRYEFLSSNIKHRFLGYAFSQKHKMIIKLDNYEKLVGAMEFLEKCELRFMLDIQHHPLFNRKRDHISIGDMNVPATVTIKKARKMVADRLAKFGNRKELVSKYGYDTKFASNLIRLITEGLELLKTGNLVFPLKNVELLRDIRNGKYTMEEVLNMANEMEKELENVYDSAKLPEQPDRQNIEQFVIDTHREYVNV